MNTKRISVQHHVAIEAFHIEANLSGIHLKPRSVKEIAELSGLTVSSH
jgi:hypothetical protein